MSSSPSSYKKRHRPTTLCQYQKNVWCLKSVCEEGKDVIAPASVDEIPDYRNVLADLLQAVSINKADADFRDTTNCNATRISSSRRELEGLGLDVDGSHESLVKHLEEQNREAWKEEDKSVCNKEGNTDGNVENLDKEYNDSNEDISSEDEDDTDDEEGRDENKKN